MSKRRVVVTGMGIVSPVGSRLEEAWENVREGKSGIVSLDDPAFESFATRVGGLVKGFDLDAYLTPKEARKCDPFIHYGVGACTDAIRDSGLEITEANGHRVGVAMGSGIGGIKTIEDNHNKLLQGGARRVSPFFIPGSIINMTSGFVSIGQHITGPNVSIVTACATSAHCIGFAGRSIEYGDADVMLAGGSEYATTPLAMAGFCAARAMTTNNDDPEGASRPWDVDRDGFVLSNGAGAVVLEEYEHAKARGAKIYAELAGYGMSADAYHMTAPSMDGPRRSMVNALKNAGISGDQVSFMNAHGTSTPLGDTNESNAIKATFGDHAYNLVVNSTKSMTGHLLGGAGGLESVFTVLSIYNQISPPTINIFEQDPECDLDYCANTARDIKIDYALKNNFGFGGTNGSLVFKKV